MGKRDEEEKAEAARKMRALILAHVAAHPVRLAPYLQDTFSVNRLHVYKELRKMVAEGILAVEGKTSRRRYTLLRMPVEEPKKLTPLERERLAWKNRWRRK